MRRASTSSLLTFVQIGAAAHLSAFEKGHAYLLPGDIRHHPGISLEVAAHVHREYQIHATLLGKSLVEFLLIVLLHIQDSAAFEPHTNTICMW